MSKKASETRGTAKCASYLFGRPVTVVDKDKSGKELARRELFKALKGEVEFRIRLARENAGK